MESVLNFVKNAYESQTNTKRFVCIRRMQYEARSRFTLSTTRECTMYSTAPHGDVRREIAHNAPPPVFHRKWDSNFCK